ncbi:Anaerobic nitric oxide reductase transcription regulator NorR [bioreactor metagenome]|uniref:Anaerobic nitric oxide reductase transcription regulator NorR n=1 Tax=bioreactor metagenome TaxID=1076179 RepID=A0A644WFF6_9ZZZZ
MCSEQRRWENLHDRWDLVKELPEPLPYFWKRCSGKQIDPSINIFPVYSDREFQKTKEESIKIYAYSNRFLHKMTEYFSRSRVGFALFDSKCCLLRLYGSDQFIDWCHSQNITIKTDWREDAIGANAVSVGMATRKSVAVVGSEHYCHALINTAMYFSPFIVDDDKATGKPIFFGGLALISPFENRNQDYLMMAAAAANDVALHLYTGNSFYELYYTETKGLLSVDVNTLTGKPHILYHNSAIFNILETPYANLSFKKVDTLFDPLPQNVEFWDIIKTNRKITDEDLTLSIRGKEDHYIVTTETYWQEHLGFRGIRFFITTAKEISYNVSKHIGNNALLTFDRILGNNSDFKNVISLAETIAKSDSNVLILGESGVGKDIFAQAIHNASERKNKPFIVVNCAAFPRDLIASELFGYEGGAFTGSKKGGNIGKFELANTGTIFLDEIGDMPLDLQATILRVIEQKSFMRLGSSLVTNVNVKVIAATNANLQQLIAQKKFRADLYYRLSTLRLNIPPLRERGEDIILLARHFIESVSRRIQKPNIMTLSDDAQKLLCQLPWHGNVRELQNLIEGVVQLFPIDVIEPKFIIDYLGLTNEYVQELAVDQRQKKITISSNFKSEEGTELAAITKKDIEDALVANQYNKTNTAKYLGISRKTLYRWMENYSISY